MAICKRVTGLIARLTLSGPARSPPPAASQVSHGPPLSNGSSKARLAEDGDTYACECGANSHGDDLACDKCGMWFHQWCYGYGWVEDDAFDPDEPFECWTCQAARAREGADKTREIEIDKALLNLADLAVLRRCKSERELAMSCKVEDAEAAGGGV